VKRIPSITNTDKSKNGGEKMSKSSASVPFGADVEQSASDITGINDDESEDSEEDVAAIGDGTTGGRQSDVFRDLVAASNRQQYPIPSPTVLPPIPVNESYTRSILFFIGYHPSMD
jgi:hypothetical protein